MATITYDRTTRHYPGAEHPAVDGLRLDVADGEFLVLVGPSGCGKSTSLRMLAGLEDVDDGAIHIGSREVTHLAPRDRDIAMVFQNYALYPHMSVAGNMGFALRMAGMDRTEIADRVRNAARLLRIEEFLDRKPKELSGGQRQRVAMGRAIVREPQVFLMDEPLSNLDAKLRSSTRAQIAALQRRLGVTTVYVTHDQVEAMTMGDRVAVLDEGVLQQCDTPRALYDRPANAFVAGFTGSPAMNLPTAAFDADGASLGGTTVPLPREVLRAAEAEGAEILRVGLRPEALYLDTEGIPLTVELVEELGAEALCHGVVDTGDGDEERLVVRVDSRTPPRAGERVRVGFRTDEVHAFSALTGERLGD
ncbi:multiple sugar transport system ATP-binding protein [Actinopolyspora biskrensis]|uniref:Multiple sugar transport system ATP-binding protein n=1 Tax=Actinopolyspora biskrensis TaxID=1470178 RepID=A0A852Z3U1_9ACTN|nr:sn-glycerol-3-phosphate ABC transporter ATP-binding protein UgpC [Actinopolyspora biskrensis]NYH76933.1 multiple sugar transport system ATP-binding protein [Actinopolyspora biskrensis]